MPTWYKPGVLRCVLRLSLAFCGFVVLTGCASRPVTPPSQARSISTATATPDRRKRHIITADDYWRLTPPAAERFDASGLAFLPSGELLVVNNLSPRLHVARFGDQPHVANLIAWPGGFSQEQLKPVARGKRGAWDLEGLAVDESGHLHVSEEGNYWVLRVNLASGAVERLPLDWPAAKLDPRREDPNASLEGVAVGGGYLFVAKERSPARVFVFDAATYRFLDAFVVRPVGGALVVHYSDLCWFDDRLYVLLRHQRSVLAVNPTTRQVLAEYDYRALEQEPGFAYRREHGTGVMEGLAVDREFIWLVTDNNGLARKADSTDIRPTLFRCRRPDI
jgi:hypothetical protein